MGYPGIKCVANMGMPPLCKYFSTVDPYSNLHLGEAVELELAS